MAILRDSFNNFTNGNDVITGTDSQTIAFNNVAGNLLLVGVRKRDNGDTVTGVTYSGVAMIFVGKVNYQGVNWLYLFSLLNPATGNNNIVSSFTGVSGAADHGLAAVSYSGVSQSGFPDASHTASATSSATVSDTVTFAAPPGWVTMWAIGSNTLTASTNSTSFAAASQAMFFDSNGSVAGPTYNMQATQTAGDWGDVMVSFVVPGVAGGPGISGLTLLGVGS